MQKVQDSESYPDKEKSSISSISSFFQTNRRIEKVLPMSNDSSDQIQSNIVAQFLSLKSRRSQDRTPLKLDLYKNLEVSEFDQQIPLFIERGAEISYKSSIIDSCDHSLRGQSKKYSTDISDMSQSSKIQDKKKKEKIKQIDEHLLEVQEVLLKYQSNITYGIDNVQASLKLKKYGQNRMEIFQKRMFWKIFLNQFNLFTLMMLGIGTLAFLAYDVCPLKDKFFLAQGSMVYAIILIQSIIMVIQEIRIKQANEKFSKSIWSQEIYIIREGIQQKIASELLVPGDIILIEENDRVPADVRILESNQLMIDNSLYTGESQAIILNSEVTINSAMNEAKNIALQGTNCVYGNGKAIVIRTGRKTILSQIAQKSQNLNKNKSRLEKEIQKFIRIQTLFCCIIIILGIIIWLFTYDNLNNIDFIINYIIDITLASIPLTLVLIVKLQYRIISSQMFSKGLFFRNTEQVDTISRVSMLIYDERVFFNEEQKIIQKVFINNKTLELIDIQNSEIQLLNGIYIFINQSKEFYCFLLMRQNKFSSNISIDCDDKQFIQQLEGYISKDIQNGIQEKVIAQFTFDFQNQYSLTIIQEDDYYVLQFTGIPEELWRLSDTIMVSHQIVTKTFEHENQFDNFLKKVNLSLESTIAFARTTFSFQTYPRGYQFEFQEIRKFIQLSQNLTFLGVLSYNLPIDIKSATSLWNIQLAGIRVVFMYDTQEHPQMAKILIQKLELMNETQIISGQDLQILVDSYCEQNEEQVEGQLNQMCQNKINIFARINPSQKLMLINAFKKTGHCIAAIGVEKIEAPCLKFCDLGISLVNSSDLCKDTAQIVLLDHKQVPIELIYQSFEYGRRFTQNILKLILFSIPIKFGQIIPILLMLFLGIPLPLTSTGVLYISILVNFFPSLSIVFSKSPPDLMFCNPKRIKEPHIKPLDYLRQYTIPGIYACAVAMMCYLTTMNILGFDSYVNLIRKDSYSSQYSDGFYNFNASNPYLGNLNLKSNSISQICSPQNSHKIINPFAQNQSYRHIHQDNFDLRNVIVECGPCSSLQIAADPTLQNKQCWVTAFQLSDSSICPKEGQNQTLDYCHSLLSLDIAQQAVVMGLLLWYSFYMVINKNQNISFRYYQPNFVQNNNIKFYKKLLIAIIALLIISALLLEIPYKLIWTLPNKLFFAMLGLPGVPFIILMSINYELEKYYEKQRRKKIQKQLK